MVGHLGIPKQFAGEAIEGDHVRVVGRHEDALLRHRRAAIDFAGQFLGDGALIVPDLAARAGVQCVALVGRRDIHDALKYDRRTFQRQRACEREHPLELQAAGVGRVDLLQVAVTVAGGVAIVAGPVGLRSYFPIPAALAPQ